MRKANRRWLGLLVPLVGIGAALALPPVDEYAPLDRIGTRYDPIEAWRTTPPPSASASVRARIDRMNDARDGQADALDRILRIGRHRAWRFHAPEAEARQRLEPFFSTRNRWQKTDGATSSTVYGERRGRRVSTSYDNDDTGDHADVVYDTQTTPGRVETTVEVAVSQAEASLEPWALAKRWARRMGL